MSSDACDSRVEVLLRFIIGCFQDWVLLPKQMQLDDPRKRNEGKDATEEVTTDAAEGPKYGEKLLWKWLLLFKAIKIFTNMVLCWFAWLIPWTFKNHCLCLQWKLSLCMTHSPTNITPHWKYFQKLTALLLTSLWPFSAINLSLSRYCRLRV